MLNGLAGYIFGKTEEDQSEDGVKNQKVPAVCASEGGEKSETESCDDGWILIKDTNVSDSDFRSFPPSEESSSRSSPVLLMEPDMGVMESSNFENLLQAPGNNNLRNVEREMMAELFQHEIRDAHLRAQQEAEYMATSKNLSQGKIKRANLAMEVKASSQVKKRKAKMKQNLSGRNNDRKCQ